MLRMLMSIGLLIGAIAFAQESKPETATWETSLAELREAAGKSNKPILIEFTADWCTYCKLMEERTLSRADVKTVMQDFETGVLNYDLCRPLAQEYGINGIPAFVALTPRGELATKVMGFLEGDAFIDWLTSAEEKVGQKIKAQRAFDKTKTEVVEGIKSTNPETQTRSVTRLLNELNFKNADEQAFAREQLAVAAKINANVLKPFLEDPRLMQRIFIANALKGELGDAFVKDVWVMKYD